MANAMRHRIAMTKPVNSTDEKSLTGLHSRSPLPVLARRIISI